MVSVDTKKKELVGSFANGGRERQPSGEPEGVNVHDAPEPELGKAIPYGVDDLGRNSGWVGVGVVVDPDPDPAAVAAKVVDAVGIALPTFGSGKSWTLTCSGSPEGCHSAPPPAKRPTSSFFLASTLTTGCPAAR